MSRQIIPAILTNDPVDLQDKLESVSGAVEWAHFDVMDGDFVNNSSLDIGYLQPLKHQLKIEAHLMVKNPERWLQRCKDAGVDRVIFHYEATDRHSEVLEKIDELGMKKGIALKAETPVDVLRDYIHRLDEVVLHATAELGFSGQEFLPETLDKIKELRKMSASVNIGVDGGVSEYNIKAIAQAGANYFIITSALFFYMDRKRAIEKLKHLIKK